MSKRVKIIVSALLVILLTVGTAATVVAQEEPTPTPEAGAKGLLARVAEILDIPEENLTSAFEQARQEMRDESLNRCLSRAVEMGRFTEEEAGEIEEWWGQKPDSLDQNPTRATIRQAIRGRQMIGIPRGWGGPRAPQLAD